MTQDECATLPLLAEGSPFFLLLGPRLSPSRPAPCLLWQSLGGYIVGVISQICKHLDIYCLTIKHLQKSG